MRGLEALQRKAAATAGCGYSRATVLPRAPDLGGEQGMAAGMSDDADAYADDGSARLGAAGTRSSSRFGRQTHPAADALRGLMQRIAQGDDVAGVTEHVHQARSTSRNEVTEAVQHQSKFRWARAGADSGERAGVACGFTGNPARAAHARLPRQGKMVLDPRSTAPTRSAMGRVTGDPRRQGTRQRIGSMKAPTTRCARRLGTGAALAPTPRGDGRR